jgi:lysyl-tRNA synthetase class 2
MIMTDSASIQDVLFFPQMRPEKKAEMSTDEEFISLGFPIEWIPLLREKGYNTVEELKAANPNKLANDLNGLRKKKKLDLPALNPGDVSSWLA